MTDEKKFISHLSEIPWGSYTKADYSIEQWHNACLIHQHDGPPTSKEQCKLPVKTPNGATNRNGVYAAAAALAGARGGVNASSDEKSSAAKALVRMYKMMDAEPPPSLMTHSNDEESLEHYGTKGMRWGVRKSSSRSEGSGVAKLRARIKDKTNDPDFRRKFIESSGKTRRRTLYRRSAKSLSSEELKRRIERMELERKYNDLNAGKISQGKKKTDGLLAKSGKKHLEKVISESLNIAVGQAFKKSGHKLVKDLGGRL